LSPEQKDEYARVKGRHQFKVPAEYTESLVSIGIEMQPGKAEEMRARV